MAKYDITIVNGEGTSRVPNGTYDVTTSTPGYLNTSITPAEITIVEGTNEYQFEVAAEGTLTLHVTEDGTAAGTPVIGATFYRCDSEGNTYGNIITSTTEGNAVFLNVPYADTGAPIIYYKQVGTDSVHEFDPALKNTTLTTQTAIVEVSNPLAAERTITYTDANYEGLKITSATIGLD